MAVHKACQTPGCKGVLHRDESGDLLRCDTCQRAFRVVRKSAGVAPPTADPDDDLAEEEDPAQPRKRRRARRKRRQSGLPGLALLEGITSSIGANLSLILKLSPIAILLIGMFIFLAYRTEKNRIDKLSAELAPKLFVEVGSVPEVRMARPYVRGRLAILETQSRVKSTHQDANRPEHWINTYVKPPFDDPDSIGSVIVVEWTVLESMATDGAGNAMGLKGSGDSNPVMFKRWDCIVRLVDRKRKVAIYSAALSAPLRTFQEGQRVLATPGTIVTDQQLAAEFEKIRQFPQIAIDADPPENENAYEGTESK